MKKITEKDLIGDIYGFPIEVVQKMVERQVEQGNPADVTVFHDDRFAGKDEGGFDWFYTPEKAGFWIAVIDVRYFNVFFEKYPKPFYPRVMEVSNSSDFPTDNSLRRVVFMEKNGKYLAWVRAETLEEAEKETDVNTWKYSRDIEEPIELTIEDIAEKFGVDANQIKIKK